MNYSKISYTVSEDVARITLNDPGTLNAAGLDMVEQLLHAVPRAARDARCLILTGEGRGFCSGANLAGGGGSTTTSEPGRALDTHFHPLMMALREHPTPIVTAVNGAAAGVGCSIAIMGDIILAAESAYFLQAFRRIGLVPDGGSTWMLPRLIGRPRAMEMALLGDKISSNQALEWGMINRVVPDAELQTEADALAARLASGPTVALGLARRLIVESETLSFEAAIHAERNAQAKAGRTEDFREGVGAFLQKRPATFKGR
ncbi:enoyl-CoA hydratase/isomerase [bacterium]|nr:enoyl-CoA hydratase/isomerase [bacterium]